ncbi:MAG: glycosyltransferase [Dermatophilaceae bacterium]
MRVVQVSAHYPPNFVSGGTLVPQRMAHDLVDRGHEVFVYAGYLDEKRTPLEPWVETDPRGVVIRWIVTTPWTAWSDPLNTLNPPVAKDFERWLEDVRPDVVHLHSLQTLGGGMVRAAKAAGASVVVTMHDFWWTCARQFLTPADMRPCSLVVDCGSCPCAVSHEWLEQRNALLQPMLDAADVILAPSASSARVLVANGIDVRKVRVDENGLPPGEVLGGSRVGNRTDLPLRLMYAGGPDPMKGIDVLLESLHFVPQDGSWSMDLFGVEATGRDLPLSVRALPAYGRAELGDVLRSHDVLVLPSVVRESHSILTREALLAGMAVICTDTLGPEEAVRHGVNGLVVPAGEPEPLGAAIVRLAGDHDLVARMQQAELVAPIRRFRDQMDGLEELYLELVAARKPEEAGASDDPHGTFAVLEAQETLLQRILFVVGIQGAPLRYRGYLPAEALRLRGHDVEVRHYRDPALAELVVWADAIVFYRVPATIQILDLIGAVRERPRAVPLLFDIDDLIFDPSLIGQVHGLAKLSEPERDLYWRGVARYRTTMEACDGYVGSTEALCERATEVTGLPSFRFANGVGRDLARISDQEAARPRSPGPLRLGYFSGTMTHDADWALIEPAVIEVLRSHPAVELWVGGLLTTGPDLSPFGERVVRLPMLPWAELPGRLRDLDVNLAPLVPDSQFNEAKSAIKWLEASLVETPTVASPTQPFAEAIESGRTGLLAGTSAEWVTSIGQLLDDALLRRRVGTQARREALLRWGPHLQADRYVEILRESAQHVRMRGPRTASTWLPVVDDEPLDSAEGWLETFPGRPDQLATSSFPWLRSSPASRRITAALRVYRTSGPLGVARKTANLLRGVR